MQEPSHGPTTAQYHAFNLDLDVSRLPSLRTIGRIGEEAAIFKEVQIARCVTDEKNRGAMAGFHDGSMLGQDKLMVYGLITKHETLTMDVVPIFANTGEGQLEGLMYMINLMVSDVEAVDPTLVTALGLSRANIIKRLKIQLSDKAPTETAFNDEIEKLQKRLSPAEAKFIKVLSTHCFLHHNAGCAESVKKSVRAVIKLLTGANAKAFDDICWEETEVETQGDTHILNMRERAAEGLPKPTFPDTAFDGIRIFNKLMCTKSDYGFAVFSTSKHIMPEGAFSITHVLQRVVGSRATEYLRSAAPVLRVRRPAGVRPG